MPNLCFRPFLPAATNGKDSLYCQGANDNAVHKVGGHLPSGDGTGGVVAVSGAVDGGAKDILGGLCHMARREIAPVRSGIIPSLPAVFSMVSALPAQVVPI